MKKLFIILVTTLLITGCTGTKENLNKTEFNINQNATIDYFNIKCTGYELINEFNNQIPKNGIFVKVNFDISSINDKPILIKPEKYFKLYDNGEYIQALGKDITLEPNKNKEYTVLFDTTIEDSYKLIFYSNVVTNNIAFKLK